MANLYTKIISTTKCVLKPIFPKTYTIAIAASTIGENQEMVRFRIINRSDFLPPTSNCVNGKLGGILACSYTYKSLVLAKVVNPIRNGNPQSVGRKIVVQHPDGRLAPNGSLMIKWPNQFAALGVHADYGKSVLGKISNLGSNVYELLISFARRRRITRTRFKTFHVHPERKIHLFEKPANSVGRDTDTYTFELFCNFPGRLARPLAAARWFSRCFVFHDVGNGVHDLRRFFSCGSRPAPFALILPSEGKSQLKSSLRPLATVWGAMPKRDAIYVSPPYPSFRDSKPAYKRRCFSLSMLQNSINNALASSVARSGLDTIKSVEVCCRMILRALRCAAAVALSIERYTKTDSNVSRCNRPSRTSWVSACLVLI